MIGRLLCRLGFHRWKFDCDAPGWGFDRRWESCTRCPAGRVIDHDGFFFDPANTPGFDDGHIYDIKVYPNGHGQRRKG